MKARLTPYLLDFLIEQGYQYFLSRTRNIFKKNASVNITLTPVSRKPVLRRLPQEFDTYFKISREPRIMAHGIDDTEVLVNLSKEDVNRLKKSLLATS